MSLQEIARDPDELVTVDADDTIVDGAKLLADREVGCLVVQRDGEPIGIVTDRDVTTAVVAKGEDPQAVAISEVMSRDPITATEDTGVYELSQLMREHSIRRIPVTNHAGKLTGIVTLDDVFVLLAEEMHGLSAVVRAESPPY